MQREPIQFGPAAAFRTKRFARQPFHHGHNPSRDVTSTSVLDEAFAGFTRVDAGTPSIIATKQSVAQNWPTVTQALISDIATQLESLDSQRRRLAQLLDVVDTSAPV